MGENISAATENLTSRCEDGDGDLRFCLPHKGVDMCSNAAHSGDKSRVGHVLDCVTIVEAKDRKVRICYGVPFVHINNRGRFVLK